MLLKFSKQHPLLLRFFFLLLLTGTFLLPCTSQALAGRYQFANHVGFDLYEIRVTPHSKDLWSSELLRGRILRNQNLLSVSWDTGTHAKWDIDGKDSQGNSYRWDGLDLTKVIKITLNPHNATFDTKK